MNFDLILFFITKKNHYKQQWTTQQQKINSNKGKMIDHLMAQKQNSHT